MKLKTRAVVALVPCAVLLAVAWSSVASQSAPVLNFPFDASVYAGQPITLPLNFQRNGVGCSALVFSVDYDQSMLFFDPSDADGDGVPDAVAFVTPAAFGYSVTFDAADTDGELDILLVDTFPPLTTLPDGTLLHLTLIARSAASGTASLGFSLQPAPSCGTPGGASVPVTAPSSFITIRPPQAMILAQFGAEPRIDHMAVTWETVSEVNLQGFHLWRALAPTQPETRMNPVLIPAQSPGSSTGNVYSWPDYDVLAGQPYWYWLEVVNVSGSTSWEGPVNATMAGPTVVKLSAFSARVPAVRLPPWLLHLWFLLKAWLAS